MGVRLATMGHHGGLRGEEVSVQRGVRGAVG